MAQPFTGDPKPFAQEWVKWSRGGKETFPGPLDIGSPHTMVPKSISETLIWSTVRLREHKNVSADKIIKVEMFK